MTERNKVFLIFIDAFSSKYLTSEAAPFLHGLYEQGQCRTVEHLAAFEGIGATIFSGAWPETNGIWTNFIRSKRPANSLSGFIWTLSLKAMNLIPSDRLSWDLRFFTYRMLGKPVTIPNLIPPELANYFESRLKVSIFRNNALGNIPTLFDVLRKENKSITVINRGSDENIASKAVVYLKGREISDLTYLKFSSLDLIGHKFGPEAERTLKRAKDIDGMINLIIQEARKQEKGITFLIFSDHGMAPVSKTVDMLKILKKHKLRMPEDYLVFLDSTMARFWFRDVKVFDFVKLLLSQMECGFLPDDKELELNRLPVNKDEYGELIFALKEGYLMHPDFFHRRDEIGGMHGYFYSEYDKPVIAIYPPGNLRRDNIRFIDIAPSVLTLMNLPVLNLHEGKSIMGGNG